MQVAAITGRLHEMAAREGQRDAARREMTQQVGLSCRPMQAHAAP